MTDQPSPTKPKQVVLVIALGIVAALVLVFPLWLYVKAFSDAQLQQDVINSYVKVDAKVLGGTVTSFKGDQGATHYQPEVHYKYTVDGTTYSSTNLSAMSIWGTEEWANSFVAQYKPGEPAHAYYNPANPSQAILTRLHSFEPYTEMLQATFILACGVFVFLKVWFERKRPPQQLDNGRFQIPVGDSLRERLLSVKLCTAVWYGFGGVAAAHYFYWVPSPHMPRRVHFFEGFAILGLIPLTKLIRRLRMNRSLDDAQLTTEECAPSLDRPVRFTLSQNFRRELQIQHFSVRLLCVGRRDKSRRMIFEATPVEFRDRTVRAGETLQIPVEVALPPGSRPSGPDPTKEFNSIDWEVRLESKMEHNPTYRVKFKLNITGSPTKGTENSETASDAKPRGFVDVRPIEPDFAGTILSKGNIAVIYLIVFVMMGMQFLGIGMVLSVYPVLFPDDSGARPFFDVTKSQAELMAAGGVAFFAFSLIYCLFFPSLFSGCYLYWVAKRAIGRRRDAIVQPSADSVYVDIIPRQNWNRVMLDNAADIGFLKLDLARKEILFEGDRQRYRIPANALLSCELKNVPGNGYSMWLMVIRANSKNGVWEAPVMPRLFKRRKTTKARLQAAQELEKKIQPLLAGITAFESAIG